MADPDGGPAGRVRVSVFSGQMISGPRIGVLLSEELAWLRAHREDPAWSRTEELCGWFVLWWAVFAPEVVRSAAGADLAALCAEWDLRDEYDPARWRHTVLPATAQFVMSGDAQHLAPLHAGLDHPDAELRTLSLTAAAFVAPRLLVAAADVTHRLRHNLGALHSVPESLGVALLLDGTAEEKRALLRGWLFSRKLCAPATDELRALLAGRPLGNPFAERFRSVERYVLLRALTMVPGASGTTAEPGAARRAEPPASQAQAGPTFDQLWELLRQYAPLRAELGLE